MSEAAAVETVAVESNGVHVAEPKANKKKAAPKKPAAKKEAKVIKEKVETQGEYGIERSHDLPWSDKKVAIFKALKGVRAVDSGTSVTAAKVAEKAEVTARDVRHYCYHAKAGKLVGLAKHEGVAGYSFYLTAKGLAIDPAKAQKEQNASK